MKMRLRMLYPLLVEMIFAGNCFAGGAEVYELGSPGVGLAAAGEAARAQDATTVFTNPAGMIKLDRSQYLIGIQGLYGDTHFDRSEDTTVEGSASGNPVGVFPGGSFFYVHDVTPDLRLGFGGFSYFGLGLEFDNEWSGRYYVQDTASLGFTLMPAVAYRVNEYISVGAGLNAMFGLLRQQVGVNNPGPIRDDGKLEIEDTDWGFGADLGVMVEFDDKTRVGLRYVSEVELNYNDTPEFHGLGPVLSGIFTGSRQLDLGMTVPTDLMASVYHELNDSWALLGSAGWQDWSSFGRVDVGISSENSPELTIDIQTKDTWHVSGGAQHKLSPDWLLSTGLAYDSSMFDDEDRTITIPVGATWRWGLGVQYALNSDVTLGVAYELAYAGDLPVDQERGPLAGRIAGEYGNTTLHYLACSVQWKL